MKPLTIQFPKFVLIENTRLAIFYYVLAVAAMGVVLQGFITSQAYFDKIVPTGRVYFWAERGGQLRPADLNKADDQKDFCSKPEQYNYCYDKACSWAYRNFRCMDICHLDADANCFDDSERWAKQQTSLFFPTYFNETINWRGANGALKEQQNAQWFVKGVEGLAIGFAHEFSALLPDGMQRGNSYDDNVPAKIKLLTVLRDSNSKVIKRWPPGENIVIPLEQILKVSGVDLDSINKRAKTNYLKDAHIPYGALMRITGTELQVEMSYENSMAHGDDSWDGPVCYIDVRRGSFAWHSKPQIQTIDNLGSTRLRYYYGLSVNFKTTGQFLVVSMNNFINLLTSLSVFVQSAKMVVFFVAIWGLGHLSKIYRRFSKQRLDLTRECEGAAARLMCYSQIFESIEVEHTMKHGITEEHLSSELQTVFDHKHSKLDEDEIKRFGSFVFTGLANYDGNGETISQQDYTRACTMSDVLGVDLLVGLFDFDRKKPFLEDFFIPGDLRTFYADKGQKQLGDKVVPESNASPKLSCPSPPELKKNPQQSMDNEASNSMVQQAVQKALKNDQQQFIDKEALDSAVQHAVQKALSPLRDALWDVLNELEQKVEELQKKQIEAARATGGCLQTHLKVQEAGSHPVELQLPKPGTHTNASQMANGTHRNLVADTHKPLALAASAEETTSIAKGWEGNARGGEFMEVRLEQDREELSRIRSWLSFQGISWNLDMSLQELRSLRNGLHDGDKQLHRPTQFALEASQCSPKNPQLHSMSSHLRGSTLPSAQNPYEDRTSADMVQLQAPPRSIDGRMHLRTVQLPSPARVCDLFMSHRQQQEQWLKSSALNDPTHEAAQMVEEGRYGEAPIRSNTSLSPDTSYLNGRVRNYGENHRAVFLD